MPEARWLPRTGALFFTPFFALACLNGCSSSADEDEDAEEINVADASAAIDLRLLDIWAQPLPAKDLQVAVTHDGRAVRVAVNPATSSALIFLKDSGRYEIKLNAPMHETGTVELDYDGTNAATGLKVAAPSPGTGVSVGHAKRTVDGKELETHGVFVGLRHQYFSAQGRPARRGNKVSLMMDGEEAWSTVHQELLGAKGAVHLATWWWESGFEMIRSLDPAATVEQRWSNTLLGTLEKLPATKRAIVGQFWGQDSILSWINTDSKLRGYAAQPNDNFEFMGQANETRGSFRFQPAPFVFGDRVRGAIKDATGETFDSEPPIASTVPSHQVDIGTGIPIAQDFFDGLLEAASYHQKFITVDSKVAFVGGMNLRQNDWDTSDHHVFEPRRMKTDATMDARLDVAGMTRVPDEPPRKDYMVRIEGPSAQDVDDVFHERWDFLRKQAVKFSENTSQFDVKHDLPANGTTQLQVTATLPQPFNENAIAETWFNAVRHATKYIYIEDQYFRIPLLNDAIVQRMKEQPNLKLVVITMSISRSNPACAQSKIAYGLLKQAYPDRVSFYQLRTFDNRGMPESSFLDMDTHSKMLMVDDTFLSVGSCNKNNRGIIYEGELNVAVADPAFVTAARKRILGNILGTDAKDDWIQQLAASAASNDKTYASWAAATSTPVEGPVTGFAYSLNYPRVDDCLLMSIGPDRT
jgi:hypothetical protein